MFCMRYSNAMFGIKFVIYVAIISWSFPKVSAVSKIVADVASDLSFGWKVVGEYIYVPRGEQLSEFSSKLPVNFPFDSIFNSRGIWIILPRLSPVSTVNNVTLWTNKVSFSYSTSARLLDSVMVKHNSGGHATINIIANNQNYTQTPEQMFPNWLQVTVPMGGTSRFTIEATTTMEHDYILIDRIEGNFMETTTSTRRPRSSTTGPQPLSGQQSLHGSIFMTMSMILFDITQILFPLVYFHILS